MLLCGVIEFVLDNFSQKKLNKTTRIPATLHDDRVRHMRSSFFTFTFRISGEWKIPLLS